MNIFITYVYYCVNNSAINLLYFFQKGMINLPQYANSILEPKTKTSDRLLNTNLRENVELHSSVIAMTEVY